MMKLDGYVHCMKISPEVEFGGHTPHPSVPSARTLKCGNLLSHCATVNKLMWACPHVTLCISK